MIGLARLVRNLNDNPSEAIGEAKGDKFLELPIAMLVVALGAIIESREDEELGGDILIELEGKGVFPLQLATLIGGIAIETGKPADVVRELPFQVDRKQRTNVVQ